MEPILLAELKTEKCLRISAEDLIDLCELRGSSSTRSPSKKTKAAKPKILVIDVRSQEEYPFIIDCSPTGILPQLKID